jgi:chemotaxis protein MotB
MKAATITLSFLLTVAVASGGYLYLGLYQPLKEECEQLKILNNNLHNRASNLNQELNKKVLEIWNTKKQKQEEIEQVKSTKDSLISEMEKEIKNNQIQITQLADKLQVSIVDKILFPSGKAEITSEGLKVLERVGNILKKSKNKIIRVEGHTDNVPITSHLKSRFSTNWELSTARATTVVRFLQEKVKIDPEQLEAVGLGEYHPIASNDTDEERAQNRRIEIALLPFK